MKTALIVAAVAVVGFILFRMFQARNVAAPTDSTSLTLGPTVNGKVRTGGSGTKSVIAPPIHGTPTGAYAQQLQKVPSPTNPTASVLQFQTNKFFRTSPMLKPSV
jgi:hypothetical protein